MKIPSGFSAALAATVVVASLAAPGLAAQDKPLKVKLTRVDGGKVSLAELVEGPTLLELWATWCHPCREQAEIVEGLAAELTDRGVAVYAVNVGEKRDLVADHLAESPGAWPVLLDPVQAIPTRLGFAELPALVVLDGSGRVVATALGLTDRDGVLALLDQLGAD